MKNKSLVRHFLLVGLIVLLTVSAFGAGQEEKKAG